MNKRKDHISRVYRRVSENPKPVVNTVFGEEHVMVTKYCPKCKTVHPLDNFYFESKRDLKNKNENDPKSRRKYCIPCYDETY